MVEIRRVKFHSNLRTSDNEPTGCVIEEEHRDGVLFGYYIHYADGNKIFYHADEVTVEDIKFPNRSS